jgi:hypothetical protein
MLFENSMDGGDFYIGDDLVFGRIIDSCCYTSITDGSKFFANYFVGRPYLLGSLGDGALSCIDQRPFMRSDVFDCVTFVVTVLALSMSSSVLDFVSNMKILLYVDGNPGYVNRMHFISGQWNSVLAVKNILCDITAELAGSLNDDALKMSSINLNVSEFFKNKTVDDVFLIGDCSAQDKIYALNSLKQNAGSLLDVKSEICFISFQDLFLLPLESRCLLYSSIPDGSVFEIVRCDWGIENKIGTLLDVCHMGFIFADNGQTTCCHASSVLGGVVSVACDEYFRSYLDIDSSSGVNIQKINYAR